MREFLLIILSSLLIFTSSIFGEINLNIYELLNRNSIDYQIFWNIRVPRVVLAFFAGGILALSGLIFQIIFKNPMSTPFTLGVANGATLFTAIAIIFGFNNYISFFAFIGAIITVVLLFIISSKLKKYDTSSLLLIGIALSFFYSASIMSLFYISSLKESYEIVRFSMGSLDIVGFESIYLIVATSIIFTIIINRYQNRIKLMLISNEFATLKGVDVKITNYILILTTSIAISILVSITGPIGFVGLIVPHIVKKIYRVSMDNLIVQTFFYGAIFLLFCDFISRNLGTTSDIPIGVITSFLGAPFFIYLVLKR